MKAQVYVTLRKDVLDPQGKAVANALLASGFEEVAGVRVGKYIELELKPGNGDPQERIQSMCERLLANPVIEDFRFEVQED